MSKIRTLIAHKDERIKNEIVDSIKNLDFVEIVGTATNGIETYDKIVELKPEMVFSEYNFENMNGLDLMKKSKEKLQHETPIFNIIVDDISNEEVIEATSIVGDKLNALVRRPYRERTIDILKDYKNYTKQ